MRHRAAALLLSLLCPALALAWGPQGHRIVAGIAQGQLDPKARAAVAELLQGEADPTLAGVANWADELRDTDPSLYRRTSRWHFVDYASGDCDYVPARDCPGGDCVVAATEEQLRLLGDASQPRAVRAQALKFVVHLVSDIHQPLHADNHHDRGGNDYQVDYHGRGGNLHAVWDTLIIGPDGFDAQADAQRLARLPIAPGELRIDATAPERWAAESCRAIDAASLYPRDHRIDDAYLTAHRPLAEYRLRLAGARLAAELNAVLGDAAPPAR